MEANIFGHGKAMSRTHKIKMLLGPKQSLAAKKIPLQTEIFFFFSFLYMTANQGQHTLKAKSPSLCHASVITVDAVYIQVAQVCYLSWKNLTFPNDHGKPFFYDLFQHCNYTI